MAYIRSLSTRAKLLSGRYHMSITHIFNRQHHDTKLGPDHSLPGINCLLPQRAFGVSVNGIGCLDSPLSPKFFGASFCRFLSTSASDGEDEKIKPMIEIADILNDDTSVQVISSHTPAANEVAVAAADSLAPVAFFQHFIDAVHSVTGLNWWASIILTTLMVKGAVLPIHINAVKDCRKYILLLPHAQKELKQMERMDFLDLLSSDKDFKNLDELFSIIFRLLGGLFIGTSFHICLFMGILNMAENVPSFKVGGVYWLLDLSTPDSYFIFPFLTAMIILLRTEGKTKHETIKRFSEARKARNFWRSIAIISVPFTMFLPKAVFCYWITSELFSIAFAKAVKLYGVKKFYGVPEKEKPSGSTKTDQN